MTAALGALIVPATAGAATKAPVISKVTPRTANVGAKLTITGKNFRRGKAKNSVLFRSDHGKTLFVKADVSTAKKLTVLVPKTLEKYMLVTNGKPVPTRFRLKVLSTKLAKVFTAIKGSPIIGPERPASGGGNSDGAGVPTAPDGDCDGDGVKNGVDADDDNDLLPDSLELKLGLDPCVVDTDGDGVEDGFEYQSAIDLNNDDYQSPNTVIPYPGKRPYPNPLFKDANLDYDGDGLTLADEYNLWKYTYTVNHTAVRTLSPLSYSDGLQYSLSHLAGGNGVHVPDQPVDTYLPPQNFRAWADLNGYGSVQLFSLDFAHAQSAYDLFDLDRSGGAPSLSEHTFWNLDGDGYVSDDERDEDADGLNNYFEQHGPMTDGWWKACYSNEGSYPIAYAGTSAYDSDSDNDGILDGADDQDHDDVPNIMELSRSFAGNHPVQAPCNPDNVVEDPSASVNSWVQPFNPCLPDINSRTCPRHPVIGQAYPPFDASWKKLILN